MLRERINEESFEMVFSVIAEGRSEIDASKPARVECNRKEQSKVSDKSFSRFFSSGYKYRVDISN